MNEPSRKYQGSEDYQNYLQTINKKTPDVIIKAARRLLPRHKKKIPNWVLAMDLYCVGSTYAHFICADNGLNPDAEQ